MHHARTGASPRRCATARTATRGMRAASIGGMATTAKEKEAPRESDRQYVQRHRAGLSRSAQRARWIDSPEELADTRPGQTLATRSHEVIQHWAQARGAEPATAGKRHEGRPTVLRFQFPDYGGDRLECIPWADWLGTFEDRHLVFLFQERLKNGTQSNFFRLDNPDRPDREDG